MDNPINSDHFRDVTKLVVNAAYQRLLQPESEILSLETQPVQSLLRNKSTL